MNVDLVQSDVTLLHIHGCLKGMPGLGEGGGVIQQCCGGSQGVTCAAARQQQVIGRGSGAWHDSGRPGPKRSQPKPTHIIGLGHNHGTEWSMSTGGRSFTWRLVRLRWTRRVPNLITAPIGTATSLRPQARPSWRSTWVT
jgi:hypothetical protein